MPETLWNCRVKEFGPLIVSIDTEGNNWFEQQKVEFNKKKDAATEEICKQVGFIKQLPEPGIKLIQNPIAMKVFWQNIYPQNAGENIKKYNFRAKALT